MSDTIIIALISLIGTLGGTFGGILATSKLTNYRIEQLEKKVDRHNSIIERTFRLEENDKGETVLVAGSTKSVNGAEPVKEAADEIVLKDKGEISAYKSLISAGKLKFGSANKEQDKDSVSVFSTDYEFIK